MAAGAMEFEPANAPTAERPAALAGSGPGRRNAGCEPRLADLEARVRRANSGRPLSLRDWLALAEAWRIAQALREAGGNRSAAARALGIGRRTLYTKIGKLGITQVWRVASRGSDPRGEGPA